MNKKCLPNAACFPLSRVLLTATILTLVLVAQGALAQSGNVLISDQFNNRVIVVNPATHQVVWRFGNGSDVAGPHSVVGVNDAERFGSFTLISGTGIPPSDPPLPGCSDAVNGCPDNRVFIVGLGGNIVWQYGKAGATGPDVTRRVGRDADGGCACGRAVFVRASFGGAVFGATSGCPSPV